MSAPLIPTDTPTPDFKKVKRTRPKFTLTEVETPPPQPRRLPVTRPLSCLCPAALACCPQPLALWRGWGWVPGGTGRRRWGLGGSGGCVRVHRGFIFPIRWAGERQTGSLTMS
jgi:hypothetical protein